MHCCIPYQQNPISKICKAHCTCDATIKLYITTMFRIKVITLLTMDYCFTDPLPVTGIMPDGADGIMPLTARLTWTLPDGIHDGFDVSIAPKDTGEEPTPYPYRLTKGYARVKFNVSKQKIRKAIDDISKTALRATSQSGLQEIMRYLEVGSW